ncbi:MAG: 3-hydroxyacyl-CoA dehydrogenase NAD-binding domain-containing protein [Dehalococcoidia bacterium]|nr:3-hydroxyacyl-CoA dehydrogenase NAD-binding domain-containing protein [Dehalococcoidia bacterium]
MPVEGIKKVLVLGAGTMGLQISLVSAYRGYEVALYDISEQALQAAPSRQRMWAERAKQMGRADLGDVGKLIAGITCTTDPQKAAQNADLVSESVAEKVEVKREVHALFEKLCPPACVLTTNTSSLLASAIDPALKHPEKFAAMHFHSGLSLLVDIMRGNKTNDHTVEVLKKYIRSIGMVPMVMKKEKGGYLYNTLLGSHLKAALSLVIGGYADPQDVDRAWMLVTGQAFGPFAAMDGIGLNIVRDAGENLFGAEVAFTPEQLASFIEPFLERGELGMKTGKGFYTYPEPAFQKPDFLQGKE